MTRLVILASGTRGDVQPALALGRGLREAGYGVRVAAPPAFQPLAERCGLPFAALAGNPSELMTRPGGQSALTYDGSLLRSLRGTLRFYQAARPLYRRMLDSAWQACRGAEALVAGLPTLWAAHLAQALDIPILWAFLQPFSRTHFHPSVLLPFQFSLGPLYNRLAHRLVEQLTWQPWRAEINRWRRESLGLPYAPVGGLYSHLYAPDAVVLYGYSPSLAPAPPDWPPNHHVTGYWFLDEPGPWAPPAELERFLEQDPPALYIGFGSPGSRSPGESVRIVRQALERSGQRAVFAAPQGTPPEVVFPPSVMRTGEVPHGWLFERVHAVVHHGGAGTTGAGLRLGRPTLVLPLAIDQFFWAKRVAGLGAGPPPIPQHSLEPARLAAALRQLGEDPALRQAASEIGCRIRDENGVQRAVEIVRRAGI